MSNRTGIIKLVHTCKIYPNIRKYIPGCVWYVSNGAVKTVDKRRNEQILEQKHNGKVKQFFELN